MKATTQGRKTRVQQLVELRLAAERPGETLESFVQARYPASSWVAIARELADIIGFSVTAQSLRNWFRGRVEVTSRVRPAEPAAA